MAKDIITGLTIRQQAAQWTSLRKARGGLSVAVAKTESLGCATDPGVGFILEEGADLPAVGSELKERCGSMSGTVTMGLPASSVLVRVAELPAIDDEELDSMVELQVDKFSPFPPDSIATSYEILRRTDATSLVLMAVVQLDVAETFKTVMNEARLDVRRLDAEQLGWLQLLSDQGEISADGCQVTLLLDAASCDMIITENGLPVLLRSIGATSEVSADDLCSELEYTLTTLEIEYGISNLSAISVWHWGKEPSESTSLLRETFGVDVTANALGSLPPLSEGLARRAGRESALDLAPADWAEQRKVRASRRRLLGASIAIFCLWLAGLGALVTLVQLQKSDMATKQQKLDGMKDEAESARKITTMVRQLERINDRSVSVLEAMRAVTTVKPTAISHLDRFTFKRGRLEVRGEAANSDAVFTYERELGKLELFTDVKLSGPNRKRSGTGYDFTISMKIRDDKV